jgi:hypothetical protein
MTQTGRYQRPFSRRTLCWLTLTALSDLALAVKIRARRWILDGVMAVVVPRPWLVVRLIRFLKVLIAKPDAATEPPTKVRVKIRNDRPLLAASDDMALDRIGLVLEVHVYGQ